MFIKREYQTLILNADIKRRYQKIRDCFANNAKKSALGIGL
jgi:hypothetical protein